MNLPVKTYQDILEQDPCYDPADRGFCRRDWRGTALDVLRAKIPAQDRIWVVAHPGWIPESVARNFCEWCAVEMQNWGSFNESYKGPEYDFKPSEFWRLWFSYTGLLDHRSPTSFVGSTVNRTAVAQKIVDHLISMLEAWETA